MARPNNINMAPGGGGGAGLRAATNKALANSAKGKLQTPTATAARKAAGITGEGGGSVTPIYKQSIPPATVKVIPSMSDVARGRANFAESIRTQTVSSKSWNDMVAKNINVGKPSKTIKINSNK